MKSADAIERPAAAPARWRGARAAALTLAAVLPQPAAMAQDAGPASSNPDWPCKQILVDRISLAAVWTGPGIEAIRTGPGIEAINWRSDAAVADLVAQAAARKTPLEAAEAAIDAFAASAGADKTKKLTALFAGLFETLNAERGQIVDGLVRIGRKQKAMAAKIRAENAAIQKSPEASTPEGVDPAANPLAKKLELDLRAYDESRRSISYACEAPALVEQRLFALARSIEGRID